MTLAFAPDVSTPRLLTVDGSDSDANLGLDLERLMVSRLVIQASSGGGKSHALRYLLEQTQDRVLQLVLDHEGEFATLRERHPYLLVGRKGEIPLVPSQAHVLARRLMNLGSSAILDLSDLGIPDRQLFVKGFCEGLRDLPEAEWHPVMVVLDEAHVYAPETGRGESVSKAAVSDVANLGRKRGQALVIATQRIANVDNNTLGALQNKLIGLTVLDTDVRRASQDLGFTKADQRQRLKTLEAGEFFAFGPALCKEPTLIRTGSVQTTHPQPGSPMPAVPPAPEAIQALASQLADLSTVAAEDLDLDSARARIADLERQLDGRVSIPEEIERRREAVERMAADLDAARRRIRDLEKSETSMHNVYSAAVSTLGEVARLTANWSGYPIDPEAKASAAEKHAFSEGLLGSTEPLPPAVPEPERANGQTMRRTRTKRRAAKRSNGPAVSIDLALDQLHADDPSLNTAQLNILAILHRLTELNLRMPHKSVVATLAGYSWQGGHFNNMLGSLRSAGMLEKTDSDVLRLSADGWILARRVTAQVGLDQVSDLHDAWLARLPGAQARIVGVLLAAPDHRLSLADLAAQAELDADGGHYNNMRGALHSLGIMVKIGDYEQLTELLFPPIHTSKRKRT